MRTTGGSSPGSPRVATTVTVMPLAGRHPLPDRAAEEAARAAWRALPAEAIPVIDGLALPAFMPLAEAIAGRAIGLIHHPTALETGRAPEATERLRVIEQALFPRLRRAIVTSDATASRARRRFRRAAGAGDDRGSRHRSGAAQRGIRRTGLRHPLGRHAGAAQGPRPAAARAGRLFDLDWHLTIVGDARRAPEHAAALRALADALGIAGRVTFAGEADDAALDALWARTDLFALATHWEGYGMAVAEALARGVPVAVTGGGAAGALVTPEAGIVAPPGDLEQFSKALRRPIFDRRPATRHGRGGVGDRPDAAVLGHAGRGLRRRAHMSDAFDAAWLALREPFDAAARSRALAEALIAHLPARPRLLDLGCGTGSLFRWLAPMHRRAAGLAARRSRSRPARRRLCALRRLGGTPRLDRHLPAARDARAHAGRRLAHRGADARSRRSRRRPLRARRCGAVQRAARPRLRRLDRQPSPRGSICRFSPA